MPRIPKNADKENFLLELQWQLDRKRIKDAKKIKRLVVQKEDKTYRIDVLKTGMIYLVCLIQVHTKTLGRVKGTQYDIHTLCGEEGALLKMYAIAEDITGVPFNPQTGAPYFTIRPEGWEGFKNT